MQVTKPTALERVLVVAAQVTCMSQHYSTFLERMLTWCTDTLFYSVLYFTIPRAAHRLTGFLEETAHEAYTDYLNSIDSGKIPLKPAPEIAKKYYRLRNDATMR